MAPTRWLNRHARAGALDILVLFFLLFGFLLIASRLSCIGVERVGEPMTRRLVSSGHRFLGLPLSD
jgi:hypothetical protein